MTRIVETGGITIVAVIMGITATTGDTVLGPITSQGQVQGQDHVRMSIGMSGIIGILVQATQRSGGRVTIQRMAAINGSTPGAAVGILPRRGPGTNMVMAADILLGDTKRIAKSITGRVRLGRRVMRASLPLCTKAGVRCGTMLAMALAMVDCSEI
jgi:hypothetical protein